MQLAPRLTKMQSFGDMYVWWYAPVVNGLCKTKKNITQNKILPHVAQYQPVYPVYLTSRTY